MIFAAPQMLWLLPVLALPLIGIFLVGVAQAAAADHAIHLRAAAWPA